MLNSERERSQYLQQKLTRNGIRAEDFLQDGYQAVLFHSSSTIITANQAMAELTGYSRAELEGFNAWSLFPPQSAAIVTEKLQTKSEQPYQVLVRRKDGSLAMMELKGINMEVAGEHVRAILARPVEEA